MSSEESPPEQPGTDEPIVETEEQRLLSWALSIICNVDGGDLEKNQSAEWVTAARKWMEEYAEFSPEQPKPKCPVPGAVRWITVCDACLRASCWQGHFYCEDYKTAGTTRRRISELRRLGREHPSYWRER